MALKEVPTEELLNFQDYPTTHQDPFGTRDAHINMNLSPQNDNFPDYTSAGTPAANSPRDDDESIDSPRATSFWSFEYFQQFFNVDTIDVKSRLLGSIIPTKTTLLREEIKQKPDLYGPFWIAVTLIFTIAISGNISNYLQHANVHYNWRYDFHLVSYAATTIVLYISFVPLCLWCLLKWSLKDNELEEFRESLPSPLELVCIYGYSLFIYIPVSILWTIQVGWLQWLLVVVAAAISGSVLLFTLSHSLENSRFKLVLGACIIGLHLLLAAGFMLFFFHVPSSSGNDVPSVPGNISEHVNKVLDKLNVTSNATH